MPHHDLSDWPPLSAETNGFSLSHLVAGPKVGLFTQMSYVTVFKHFLSIFSLLFGPIDSPVHWS